MFTQQEKKKLLSKIDGLSYEEFLRRWRFARRGSPMYDGDAAAFYSKRLRLIESSMSCEERLAASLRVGWEENPPLLRVVDEMRPSFLETSFGAPSGTVSLISGGRLATTRHGLWQPGQHRAGTLDRIAPPCKSSGVKAEWNDGGMGV